MFRRILIANRGEIAVRVMRTCREMGIDTVAVYSDADAGAVHVGDATHAERIGPAAARESYLNIGAIIDAARRSGAEAVHPGYGFLSENDEFAAACVDAGLVFIGPPASAIQRMGSKIEARALMQRAGVPVVPGEAPDSQADTALIAGWSCAARAGRRPGARDDPRAPHERRCFAERSSTTPAHPDLECSIRSGLGTLGP